MRRTISTTKFAATIPGNDVVEFTVVGALTAGKAKTHAANVMGWNKKQVKLTMPLTITIAQYEIADELVAEYGTKIDAE